MLREFREFLTQGKVMDLAVAVIIGAATQAVITSLVNDVIMPIIGAIFGQPDFSSVTVGPVLLGNFLNALVSFLMIGFAVFFFVVKPVLLAREKLGVVNPNATKAELTMGDLRGAFPGATVTDAGSGRLLVSFPGGASLAYDYLGHPLPNA